MYIHLVKTTFFFRVPTVPRVEIAENGGEIFLLFSYVNAFFRFNKSAKMLTLYNTYNYKKTDNIIILRSVFVGLFVASYTSLNKPDNNVYRGWSIYKKIMPSLRG